MRQVWFRWRRFIRRLQRHVVMKWWKQTLQVSSSDPGVDELILLAEILETALVFDGLNIPEFQSFEAVSRRVQI